MDFNARVDFVGRQQTQRRGEDNDLVATIHKLAGQ
jgi:hypothetical protein